MIHYMITGTEVPSEGYTVWRLTEHEPGEAQAEIASMAGLSASEITHWADAQIGYGVELDWRAGDGSALSLTWHADRSEPGDDRDN